MSRIDPSLPRWIHCVAWLVLVLGCSDLRPIDAVPLQTPSQFPQKQSGPEALQPVQAIPLTSSRIADRAEAASKYTVEVTSEGWQLAPVQLTVGDEIEFRATGRLRLSDGHTAGPDGVARGWTDLLRVYPLSNANGGALIGRLGKGSAGFPFLIGAARLWTSPSSGPLYLRANLSPDLTGDGSFHVAIRRVRSRGVAVGSPEMSKAFLSGISPNLFAAIPRRVQDLKGDSGDMVNIALLGTRQQVQGDLAKAGWFSTDADPQDALLHGLIDTLSRRSYRDVPMSTLYLFGRSQDLAYARASAIEVAATRNHMRLWQTKVTVDGLPFWVGSATRDHGFERDQRTGGVTHHIDPDVDRERSYILASLNDAGQLKAAAYVMPSHPVHAARTATGGSFSSDGRILVLLLR
ncbi:MAG TPA: LssY C-terminal domain-containing protein [Acidobacteriaceae bacterium]|nr:LssY C-terminal domain-containing protein [Acidobacteriaceae bacterium]